LLAGAAARDADLGALLAGSRHGRRLLRAGFADDVVEAARVNASDRVLERLPGSTASFACAPEMDAVE
jgi:phosphosulfolactate phosphohydrolase-like enzyme